MYAGRIPHSILTKPNLKNVFENNGASKQYNRYTYMIRQFTISDYYKNIKDAKNKLKLLFKNAKLYKRLQVIPQTLKTQSSSILRVWAHQCECVVAQRLRRGQQMFCLYSRLWEEHALKEFIKKLRQQLSMKGKEMIFSAIGVTLYNWEENRIPLQTLTSHLKELDYIKVLKSKTGCNSCEAAKVASKKTICVCEKCENNCEYSTYDNWVPFIQGNDLMVWRKFYNGAYEYKVYGVYDDVTAEDFLNVQIDTNYRKIWDTTAVALELVEKDTTKDSNSDIIYWEMLWPTLFSNRDYVFNRRYMVDKTSNTIVIVSQGTVHPKYPEYPGKYRIADYWSNMVIKPTHSKMDKPGIEFVLTYFDNPGVNLPGSVTTWVAIRAMPDFLIRLREASLKYKKYCQQEGVSSYCKLFLSNERDPEDLFEIDNDLVTDNTISEPQHDFKYRKPPGKEPESKNVKGDKSENDDNTKSSNTSSKPNEDTKDFLTSQSPTIQAEKYGNWKYLHFGYYFS